MSSGAELAAVDAALQDARIRSVPGMITSCW
jgi:hypothetical protein